MSAVLALFEADAVLTTTCVRCEQQPATTRAHSRPDLQASAQFPHMTTGADSEPLCGGCARWVAMAWRGRLRAACGTTRDTWVVWTTPVGTLEDVL